MGSKIYLATHYFFVHEKNMTRIRGNLTDTATAIRYLLNTSLFGEKRTPTNKDDFGDAATIGVHLKRSGLSFHQLETCDFGVYLGQHKDEWVVGIIDVTGEQITAAETFNSLEELKQAWVLD